MHNPNQFMASQNLLYNFFKCILNVTFSPRFSVFEVHLQEPSTLQKVKIAMGTIAQNLILEKSQSFIFEIGFLMQKLNFKNINN